MSNEKLILCDSCGSKLFAFFDDISISVELCVKCASDMYKEGWEEALESVY